MARKNLLKGLMDDASASPEHETKSAAKPAKPRYAKGAIGAVSQSIAELKSRALVELVADQIDPGGLQDRLSPDGEADAALMASLKEYGQQVPVLVRHDPNVEGRYQIVYGRRRVAALKALGMPVKAMVRDLTDRDVVIAQGQENTARRDLSFIEKANFARQMRDAGYERKIICDALNIDKTLISRMLSVADAIPVRLIAAIGSAPGIGRDRWLTLGGQLEGSDEDKLIAAAQGATEQGSDARFDAVLQALTPKKTVVKAPASDLKDTHGKTIGSAKLGKSGTTLTLKAGDGFDTWLAENITEIHRRWKAGE